MPRYIDAVEAETQIKDLFADMPKIEFMGNVRNWREKNKQYLDCLGVIRSLKTADVMEVKHEKWEVCNILDYAQRPSGRKVGMCPRCGYLTDEFRTIVESSKKLTNFCPNCGVQMDGKETEDAH